MGGEYVSSGLMNGGPPGQPTPHISSSLIHNAYKSYEDQINHHRQQQATGVALYC